MSLLQRVHMLQNRCRRHSRAPAVCFLSHPGQSPEGSPLRLPPGSSPQGPRADEARRLRQSGPSPGSVRGGRQRRAGLGLVAFRRLARLSSSQRNPPTSPASLFGHVHGGCVHRPMAERAGAAGRPVRCPRAGLASVPSLGIRFINESAKGYMDWVNSTSQLAVDGWPSHFAVRREEGMWAGAESNRRHEDFQSSALPTELPARVMGPHH